MTKRPSPFGPRTTKSPFATPAPARPKPFAGFKPLKAAAKPEREWPKNGFEAHGNHTLAIEALRAGVCLAFNYHDLRRTVEVHTVGTTTAGRPAMSVYQVDGESEDGPIPDWRTFCFDECFDVRLSDLPSSGPRPDFKKGAKQFRRIDAEL